MFLCSIFMFVHMFLFYSVFPYADVSYPTSKRARTDSNNFKSIEANLKYNDCYKRATIIMERFVKLDTLEPLHTCSVQEKDMDKTTESSWSSVFGD